MLTFAFMETMRQQKVARLLMKELGDIFQREGVSLTHALVTITKVRLTRDLGIARVYLSIFGAKDKLGELEHIRSKTREIRFLLGKKVGSLMRLIPDLEFYEDDSLDYIENIDKLLQH